MVHKVFKAGGFHQQALCRLLQNKVAMLGNDQIKAQNQPETKSRLGLSAKGSFHNYIMHRCNLGTLPHIHLRGLRNPNA